MSVHIKDVSSVKEFIEKYYKHSRYKGRGADYAKSVLQSHEKHYEDCGYDLISRHESNLGVALYFGAIPDWVKVEDKL